MQVTRPVLLVEDDEDIRFTVALSLESVGYTVEMAEDGRKAIRRLADGLRPSMILLDMMMPDMNGEDFLAAARADPELARIPVVLLSGHDSVRQKAEELHADGCLVKPVEYEDLIAAVQRIARD